MLARYEKLLDINYGPGYSRATCSLPDTTPGPRVGLFFQASSPMRMPPSPCAVTFVDGQNLFHHAYFLGANDPYKSLKTTLKAEIDAEAWTTLHSDISRPFPKPRSGRIAVKVINHLGDEMMKVFRT